jgi:hypothetical protein
MYTTISLFLGHLVQPLPIAEYACAGRIPFLQCSYLPNRNMSTMHSTKALHTLTAVQAYRLLKENNITVEDYAQSLLSRIKERDNIVKAWEYFGTL